MSASALNTEIQVPTGWCAIYRVRQFCETDDLEPWNDFGWNDYDSHAEAVAFIRSSRRKAISTRLEVVLLAPVVLPYPSTVKRAAREIAEYKSRVKAPPRKPTPDLASVLYEDSLRRIEAGGAP